VCLPPTKLIAFRAHQGVRQIHDSAGHLGDGFGMPSAESLEGNHLRVPVAVVQPSFGGKDQFDRPELEAALSRVAHQVPAEGDWSQNPVQPGSRAATK
jgi:hypothetical protein